MQYIIPCVPVSGNRLERMHWAVRHKYNIDWAWRVKVAGFETITPQPIKRTVNIHQVRRRKLDKDNLYFSVKPIVDALKNMGVLWDDCEEYANLNVTQETGKPVRTLIEVI